MPEPEFEVYLSLLSKLLHITSAQRAEITAELHDHLEARLGELAAQGHDRDRAIALALEEFGDAAALAQHLTLPHLALRRRQLMRYSLGSIAVITVTFVLAAFYWPAQRHEPSVLILADTPPAAVAVTPMAEPPRGPTDDLRREVEEKLARRSVEVQFEDMPLEDVFLFLSDQLDLDVVLDRKPLEALGIDPTAPITLRLRKQSVTVRTLLELVLRQAGDGGLSYVIRDGIVLITSPEEGYEVQVYDCRDLLANVKVESVRTPAFGGMILPGAAAGTENPLAGGPAAGMGIGGLGGGVACYPSHSTSSAGESLINVIMAAAGDQWLSSDGQGGTIAEFDGLLVVRHSQRTHRAIEDLLTKMREKKERATVNGPTYVPGPTSRALPDTSFFVPAEAYEAARSRRVTPNGNAPIPREELPILPGGTGPSQNSTPSSAPKR